MITVRILKNTQFPPYFRQSPENDGVWEDVRFTEEEIDECDYILILNHTVKKIRVKCPRENIWSLQQEPPNEYFRVRHQNTDKLIRRVFTPDESLTGNNYYHTQPAIPWFIGKNYQDLKNLQIPKKNKNLSFITSSKTNFKGHRERIAFLNMARKELDFDLFGRGYREIDDKWEALASYKYSIVIENFSTRNYWTEKLADSFLSFTMPIYYGCTNIPEYFPDGSYVNIDINDKQVFGKIRKIISSGLFEKNLEKIRKARNLILDKYQLFPFITGKIHEWEKREKRNKETVIIPDENRSLNNLKLNMLRLKEKIIVH